jgi:uncharacterized delta-60 repeat protein
MPELGIFLGAIADRAYGYTTPARWSFNGPVYDITPEVDSLTGLPTGKIYVGGVFTTYNDITVNRIVKLNIDGTIDTSFNTGTGFNPDNPLSPVWGTANNSATAVYKILQESGSNKIYVGGAFTIYSGSSANRIIRLNLNGTRDTTFTSDISSSTYSSSGYIHTICHVSGSDKIYVGGRFNIGGIVRLNPNGTTDNSFNTGTGATRGISNSLTYIIYSIIQESGSDKIYVGGTFIQYSGSANAYNIVKLNSNGTRDTTFAAQFNLSVNSLIQESGSDKIYVAGTFASYSNNGTLSPTFVQIPARIARLNPNGTRDTNFSPGTNGFNGSVFITTQVPNSSDIYVGGNFSTYQTGSVTFTQNRISRLTSTASTSSLVNFGTGFGPNGTTVYTLAPSGSNGLYVGGNFNSYQGSTVNNFVKLILSS